MEFFGNQYSLTKTGGYSSWQAEQNAISPKNSQISSMTLLIHLQVLHPDFIHIPDSLVSLSAYDNVPSVVTYFFLTGRELKRRTFLFLGNSEFHKKHIFHVTFICYLS